MTIKEKLLKILEDKGITEYKFYKETGVSRGTLSNNSGLNADTLAKFFAYFPDIDANKILKAKNFDYPEQLEISNILNEPDKNHDKKEDNFISVAFESKNKTIEIQEREIQDLRKDKIFLQKIIEQKLNLE